MTKTLAQFQAEIKAPKGQFNKFGKYNYRSCEDIMEAVKPVINPEGFWLVVSDEMVEVGGRVYVQATATLTNGEVSYTATAYAREAETKKGMDDSQLTGSTSSYARKYALAGLFALDDTKDADATNTHADTEHSRPQEAATEVVKPTLSRGTIKKGVNMFERAVNLCREDMANLAKIEQAYIVPDELKEEIARLAIEGGSDE